MNILKNITDDKHGGHSDENDTSNAVNPTPGDDNTSYLFDVELDDNSGEEGNHNNSLVMHSAVLHMRIVEHITTNFV